MGNNISLTRNINFEDMQFAINEKDSQSNHYNDNYQKIIIINTLDAYQQHCLIVGTLNIETEIEILNIQLKKNKDVRIIIYGMNATDKTCITKYEQLLNFGMYIFTLEGSLNGFYCKMFMEMNCFRRHLPRWIY